MKCTLIHFKSDRKIRKYLYSQVNKGMSPIFNNHLKQIHKTVTKTVEHLLFQLSEKKAKEYIPIFPFNPKSLAK